MNKFKVSSLIATSCLVAMYILGSIPVDGAPAPNQVTVANTSANPVPTVAQGTTTVGGTVNIGNSPTVGISPSANTVQIGNTTNTPVLVRDVDSNAARQPFQATTNLVFTSGFNNQGAFIASVPAGKRLVIEYVSMVLLLPTGQKPSQAEIVTDNFPHFLIATQQGSFGVFDTFSVSQQVRLYADSSVAFNVVRSANDGVDGSLTATISGYLINVP